MDNKSLSTYINSKKHVRKPWGEEIWLELNDKYCYKRIIIKGGFKTSYQVHNVKLETNYIIDGKAEVWLEDDDGVVRKYIMGPDDSFTVLPNRKHRVIAITDLILQEVSTPEVDDVIRINDEFNRGDGRQDEEHHKPVVCIVAAGQGLRMGPWGMSCPKTLMPLRNKALLGYIIEKFDTDHQFIIAVKFLADHIKKYIKLCYADRDITFVDVEYTHGPGHSILACKQYLQRPFYWCVSDFYTEDPIQNPTLIKNNWLSITKTSIPELYSTVKVENGIICDMSNKSSFGYDNAFTGVSYIYDYNQFWKSSALIDDTGEIVNMFIKDIHLFNFKPKIIDIHDMGNIDLYKSLLDKFKVDHYLDNIKTEHKYIHNNKFIKLCGRNKTAKLMERAHHIKEYIPADVHVEDMFLCYTYLPGQTVYAADDIDTYRSCLKWVWGKKQSIVLSENDPNAEKFYLRKTENRLQLLSDKPWYNNIDSVTLVNNVCVKSIQYYINNIEWTSIYNILKTPQFHGDLQFDNIISNNGMFTMIDWRESFGDTTSYGDFYYDLAKLYGGMILNYYKCKDSNYYNININGLAATAFCMQDAKLNIIRHEFEESVIDKNYDLRKIKLLTALIYLNMAPLYDNNFSIYLLFMSKLMFENIDKKLNVNL